MKLSEVMAKRNTGAFTDTHGIDWTLRRTPSKVNALIRDKMTPQQWFDKETRQWYPGQPKPNDNVRQKALKVSFAAMEPEFDDLAAPDADDDKLWEKLTERADYLQKQLSDVEIQELYNASLLLDNLDLAKKVEEAAKN